MRASASSCRAPRWVSSGIGDTRWASARATSPGRTNRTKTRRPPGSRVRYYPVRGWAGAGLLGVLSCPSFRSAKGSRTLSFGSSDDLWGLSAQSSRWLAVNVVRPMRRILPLISRLSTCAAWMPFPIGRPLLGSTRRSATSRRKSASTADVDPAGATVHDVAPGGD